MKKFRQIPKQETADGREGAMPELLTEAIKAVELMKAAGVGFNETGLRAAIDKVLAESRDVSVLGNPLKQGSQQPPGGHDLFAALERAKQGRQDKVSDLTQNSERMSDPPCKLPAATTSDRPGPHVVQRDVDPGRRR